MLNNMGKITGVVIILLGVLGCSQTKVVPVGQSNLDKNWGRAYESAKYNQILNPGADQNVEPVEGLDGDAAERTMQIYKSGGEASQAPATEFGVVTIKQ